MPPSFSGVNFVDRLIRLHTRLHNREDHSQHFHRGEHLKLLFLARIFGKTLPTEEMQTYLFSFMFLAEFNAGEPRWEGGNTSCEDGNWIEQVQDVVQWRSFCYQGEEHQGSITVYFLTVFYQGVSWLVGNFHSIGRV
ncbi:hypothetical protein L798_15752 [Zootermopsis nevadensis]|uniref:Uncharacterized protein n=1 Tax=Zootermopsis nevadensis TaxID=136037 RepID=A0A067RJL9_ZOONE|nr:hypothetical protein L798_15752 [Zootermopsis nevadensis]